MWMARHILFSRGEADEKVCRIEADKAIAGCFLVALIPNFRKQLCGDLRAKRLIFLVGVTGLEPVTR
jgi:hypothetical protein